MSAVGQHLRERSGDVDRSSGAIELSEQVDQRAIGFITDFLEDGRELRRRLIEVEDWRPDDHGKPLIVIRKNGASRSPDDA